MQNSVSFFYLFSLKIFLKVERIILLLFNVIKCNYLQNSLIKQKLDSLFLNLSLANCHNWYYGYGNHYPRFSGGSSDFTILTSYSQHFRICRILYQFGVNKIQGLWLGWNIATFIKLKRNHSLDLNSLSTGRIWRQYGLWFKIIVSEIKQFWIQPLTLPLF